jgi:hypothetical protein
MKSRISSEIMNLFKTVIIVGMGDYNSTKHRALLNEGNPVLLISI